MNALSIRVCKAAADGKWTVDFEYDRTCCGEANRKITNPVTKNVFWIGFNYGH